MELEVYSDMALGDLDLYTQCIVILMDEAPDDVLEDVSELTHMDFLGANANIYYPHYYPFSAEIPGTILISWPYAKHVLVSPSSGLVEKWTYFICTYESLANEPNVNGDFEILVDLEVRWEEN